MATNSTTYPHVGEVSGYIDTSPNVGRTHVVRRSTFLVGDSISYRGAGELHARIPVEVSAVPGRDVGNLPWYVTDRLRAHRKPLKTLVIALGTNATPGWGYDDYRRVTNMVPRKTRIVFVTTYRDPARYSDEPYRGNSSTQVTYTRWMRHIAAVRPRTCVAEWRGYVEKYPSALADGVHPSEWGGKAWANLVAAKVRNCR